MPNKFSKILPWFFFAAAFQSLLAVAALLRIPSEGLSLARLALLGVIGGIFLLSIGLGLARRNLLRFEWLSTTPVIISSALLSLTFSLILFLLRYFNPERFLPYYERMSPLLWLLFLLAAEAALCFLFLKNGFHPQSLTNYSSAFRASVIPLLVLFAIFLFVAITKIGVTPDTGYWGEPGVAIQGWHFVTALLLGCTVLILSSSNSS
ncbi:MAG TPA: hypothetical protein PKJ84_14915, partial [Anaerolineales bacterium]|nr:hypothetical protein [Anaerolineales bacterium]